MRKLASIQKIVNLSPIVNADKIEVADILGWKCVVKKGEFSKGDLCVYCEVDSLLPSSNINFSFLKDQAYRIRTIRLKGQISQGICFPTSILPKDITDALGYGDWIGTDVTDTLGITQYQDTIPLDLIGKAKGYIPSAIPTSSITRVQNLQDILDRHAGTKCYETEKLDGESITFYVKDNIFGVCSKEVDFLETEDSAHWKMARELDMEIKLRSIGRDFSTQGEMIGEGIKKNKYKLKGRTVRFYNAFDIGQYRYLNYDELVAMMNELNLSMVPVISDSFILPNSIDELVELSIGTSKLCDTPREGIVICPLTEIADRGDRVILKVISPKFLIKHGE